MKSPTLNSFAITALLLTLAGASTAAENLGEILREHGWDRIIGTWVDADTNGTNIKVTYGWKFQDQVIEVAGRAGEVESAGLMLRNPKNGEVHHVAVDSQGGGGLGQWSAEDGDAILALKFVSGKGEEGDLRIRHHLEDDDTLILTIEKDDPVVTELIRAKE